MKNYCITLRQTPAREEASREEFKKAGLDVEFVYGFDAKTSGLFTMHPKGCDPHDPGDYLTVGMLNCMLSHYLVWNIVKHGSDEIVRIFEDDAVLTPDFEEKFQLYYSHLPEDWELCYAAWLRWNVDNPRITPINKYVGRSQWVMGLHCYLLKKSAAEKLIAANQSFYQPSDWVVSKTAMHWPTAYIFNDSLVEQYSRNQGKTKPMWQSRTDWNGLEPAMRAAFAIRQSTQPDPNAPHLDPRINPK